MAAVIALSTFCDIYLRRKNVTPIFLHVCSVYTNTKRLLSTHCANDTLTCLYGIKSFATLWVVLGHYSFFTSTNSNINSAYILAHVNITISKSLPIYLKLLQQTSVKLREVM